MLGGIAEIDSRQSAAAALVAHRTEHRRIGAERLELAAHWCDLHPAGEDAINVPGGPRAKRAGADGTPEVDEFAADELGCLLEIHPHAAHNLMADAVNLRHRHPRLWAHLMAGEVLDWVAVKAARLVAAGGLDLARARWVDEVTAAHAGTLPPGRFLALVEAKIIEADPQRAEARAKAAAAERYVRLGQSNELGLKVLIARATAGEVIYLDAVIDRIAKILEARGDTDSLDVRRSKALGILADPARALELLSGADGARGSQKATLHIHLSAESFATGSGVARMEGVGPITLGQVQSFLRHSNVTVKPVVDLAGGMPADCYEVPAGMREVMQLRSPFEVFPFATRTSRGSEPDHSVPYPQGETHPDNLGPLGKRRHRLKTHARGWRHRRLGPGVFLWRTPTGYWYRVDQHGTRALGVDPSFMEEHFRTLLSA